MLYRSEMVRSEAEMVRAEAEMMKCRNEYTTSIIEHQKFIVDAGNILMEGLQRRNINSEITRIRLGMTCLEVDSKKTSKDKSPKPKLFISGKHNFTSRQYER